jgi:hypothetical protein
LVGLKKRRMGPKGKGTVRVTSQKKEVREREGKRRYPSLAGPNKGHKQARVASREAKAKEENLLGPQKPQKWVKGWRTIEGVIWHGCVLCGGKYWKGKRAWMEFLHPTIPGSPENLGLRV